ncbi:MAG: bifunctional phosphopantothenoylcysteine decarboxylase/phosphopantothenate--cysteine ligase CoaBC [Phycisphaerae bacterium]|nr:bifunctional phosphopantothenoylcysteine decarboxylase/phosphopantothenate--cysteine ligase CoaBC [Phycisphaerae bacterium]
MTPQADPLSGKRVVVGVTGGIAAYKAAALVSTLVQAGADVRVIMTESATRFVAPLTFQALSHNAVHVGLWDADDSFRSAHIALADWADLGVVAPATANFLAKAACGLADDLLSTTLLAMECPVLLAPAMNCRMWNNRIVQDNVACLKAAGYPMVGPAEGHLACGTSGAGRMAEPDEILAALRALASGAAAARPAPHKQPQRGKRT